MAISKVIQTFFLDPASVNNSGSVFLTAIDLYFQSKPQKTNNVSGITNPGVSISICNVTNNVPNLNTIYTDSYCRKPFDAITAVSDASVATTFALSSPVLVSTGNYYAIVITLEDPGFALWFSKQGDRLVGTNSPSPGASGKNDGNFYQFTDSSVTTPLSDRDLKFAVKIAQFTSNNATFDLVNSTYEFLDINTIGGFFRGGEVVYQDFANTSNVTFYCNGTITVNQGNNVVIGIGTTFNTLFTANDFFVYTDGTAGNTAVVQIAYVSNATSLTLATPPPFVNGAARFKKTVIGTVFYFDCINQQMILDNSTANSSLYFSDSSILNVSIGGGSGYKNTDVIKVSGGTINALAYPTTNSVGGIVSINFANVGFGFANISSATVAIQNSSGGSSAGTNGNVAVTGIGAFVVGDISQATALITNIADWSVDQFDCEVIPVTPSDTSVSFQHTFAYVNTGGYVVNSNNFDVTQDPGLNFIFDYPAIIMSRSNEVLNTTNIWPEKADHKSEVIEATLIANLPNTNLFVSPLLYKDKLDMFVFQTDINNTLNNEFLPQGGNALSKHITTKIQFANTAEDLVVYLDSWQPLGTNLTVYGKLWNHNDPDVFDDKYWTPMIQTDPPNGTHSSSSNTSDAIQFTYHLPQYPPSNNTIGGVSTTTLASANVTGIGTSYNTDLTVGNLIKVYDPNQPNTNYMIGVVNSVVNSTLFTLDSPVANSSVAGAGILIDNLLYNYTAFNNIQNDNVARYYTSSNSPVDGFDVFALKIVMTSNSTNLAPLIFDIRAIGVSA